MSEWNPRFVAFAKANGRTAQEQADFQKGKSGRNTEFILWISQKRREFAKARPECASPDRIFDHEEFTKFCEKP